MQTAWRLDNTDVLVLLLVRMVCCVWCRVWHVGFHPESGAKRFNLQRLR